MLGEFSKKLAFLLFAFVALCSAPIFAKPFKVGVFDLAPLNFLNQNGEASGFNPDLVREAFKDTDYEPEFVAGSWSECYERLQNEEIDLMTTVALSPDREEIMSFNSVAVILVWGQVFKLSDTRVENILDLSDKPVAIMKKDINGRNFSQTLESFGGKSNVVEFQSHEEVFRAVAEKKVVAGVAPHVFGLRHRTRYGLVSTSIQFSPFNTFFATKKNKNVELLQILDKKLKLWKSDPNSFYSKRLDFWLASTIVENKALPPWLIPLVFGLIFITSFTLYGNKILNHLVKEKTSELMAREEEFKNLIDCANSIIMRIDSEKRISFINKYGLSLLKYELSDLLGKPVFEAIVPKQQSDGGVSTEMLYQAFEPDNSSSVFENENVCKDGSRVFIRWSNRAFFENNEFREMLCVGNDISEQKRLEKELIHSQKMEAIGRLAGGIAHDFNNILFVISGNVEMMRLGLENQQDDQKHFENIDAAIFRAKNTVKQLMAFSRKDASEKKVVCLADEIKESIKMLRPSFPSTIEIAENYSSLANVLADSNKIYQVVLNLCTNSMHALQSRPGIIKIDVVDTNSIGNREWNKPVDGCFSKFVKLSISDNGHGISQENLKKIFEPFFTTKETDKGTGIGLAVVHGILREHDASVEVFSEVGKGTTFEIYFPVVADKKNIFQPADNHVKKSSKNERILLIDDEESLLAINSELLQFYGYRITSFSKSRDALNAFKSDPKSFDLVITDMTMPEMTGFDLALEMLKIEPEIRIILLTGNSDLVDFEKAERAGLKGFAHKPISVSDLLVKIDQALS